MKIVAISRDLIQAWNITFHRTIITVSANSGSHFINYDTCMIVASVSYLDNQTVSENSSDYMDGVSERSVEKNNFT